MKLPVSWLRELVETRADDGALADKLTMVGLEIEEIEASPIGNVFHTKVTPNRGDWTSLLGVAREASAALDAPLTWTAPIVAYAAGKPTHPVHIEIRDTSLCPRYSGLLLGDVKNGSSPVWMADRLTACGMRPLNLIVDVTNYVMLELGQPLHAFDFDTIPDGKIVVRASVEGESIETLDGTQRILPAGSLAICDSTRPIAVAGLMGGANTEVTESTRTILLESAHFDPGSVRRTSKALGLTTEASYRFERHVDPELTLTALDRCAQLLVEFGNASILGAPADVYPEPIALRHIILHPEKVNGLLGTALSDSEITGALGRLNLSVTGDSSPYLVSVPTYRPDLEHEIDLIEEVGRITGYENLPETLPARPGTPAVDAADSKYAVVVRHNLAALGLQEISTYTLSAPSPFDDPATLANRVTIRQALSAELSGLRQSLIPNALDVLARNVRQRQPRIGLFEVGKVFATSAAGYIEMRHAAGALTGDLGDGKPADFFTAKAIVDTLLAGLRHHDAVFVPAKRPLMHPGRTSTVTIGADLVGFVAEVDPNAVKEHLDVPASVGRVAAFELNIDLLRAIQPDVVRYKPLPRFPAIARDIAAVVDLEVPYAAIAGAAASAVKSGLLADVSLQSVYTGEKIEPGKKSVALRLTFQAEDRTLTDAEVDNELASVWAALLSHVDAEHR